VARPRLCAALACAGDVDKDDRKAALAKRSGQGRRALDDVLEGMDAGDVDDALLEVDDDDVGGWLFPTGGCSIWRQASEAVRAAVASAA